SAAFVCLWVVVDDRLRRVLPRDPWGLLIGGVAPHHHERALADHRVQESLVREEIRVVRAPHPPQISVRLCGLSYTEPDDLETLHRGIRHDRAPVIRERPIS